MVKKDLEERLLKLCQEVVGQEGLVLYDGEYIPKNALLRLYIENSESQTASLDDCVQVDRALSLPFEQAQWVPEGLTLEVSSPGVCRRLRTLEHFHKALGQRIVFRVKRGKFSGVLDSVDFECRSFGVKMGEGLHYFDFDELKKANIEFDEKLFETSEGR